MAERIKPEGSTYAPIALVGEAPGTWEIEFGRPFVGPSYTNKLLPWWRQCTPQLERRDFYIDNVLDFQPSRMDAIPEHEIRGAMEALRQRIDALKGPDGRGPRVIVPTGAYALYALTGLGRVSFHSKDGRHDRPGIYDWRGSILSYHTTDGRIIKVIPTVHPANTFPMRSPGMEWVCVKDWQRIAEDAQTYELNVPHYTKMHSPCEAEVREWVEWTRAEAAKRSKGARFVERLACSADVETPYKTEYETVQSESKSVAPTLKCRGCGHTRRWHHEVVERLYPKGEMAACEGLRGKGGCDCKEFAAPLSKPRKRKVSEESFLACTGYCWRDDFAISVPRTLDYWQEPEVLERVNGYLRDFHADTNIDFGGQNFGFDAWWEAIYNTPFWSIAWDLMKMHRVQRPWSEWHDLGFQASVDTRIPFWKHEAKLPDQLRAWAHDGIALRAYNCTDNVAQRQLLDARLQALASRGRLEYYMQTEQPIDDELLPLSLHGILTDVAGRAIEHDVLMGKSINLSGELNAAAGMAIVTVNKKGVITGKIPSPQKLKVFLYEKHKLPVQYKRTKKGNQIKRSVSTDIVSIRRLMEQFPQHTELQTVGDMVLRHRRLQKKASDLKESKIEANGRMYAIFKQDTLLGRLSSSATPKDEGTNLQNQDHELRKFFLADMGDEAAR